jgi:hypothetical protein
MRRREFLGKTLAGTAGIALGTSGMLKSCKGASDKVVLALIGAGSRGRDTIISCCRQDQNVEIKTVCDVTTLIPLLQLKQSKRSSVINQAQHVI